jgi:glycosyltransferase involved in cell wall biosynthesis
VRPQLAIIAVDDYPGRRGGFDSFVSGFAPRACEYCDVTVYCQTGESGHVEESLLHGVRRTAVPRRPGHRGLWLHRRACMAHALSSGASALYLLGSTAVPLAASLAIYRASVSVLVNPDGVEWRRSGYRWWERCALAGMSLSAALGADVLVCDARAIARRYSFLRPGRPTVVMPYAVSVPNQRPTDAATPVPVGILLRDYYLMVGRCVRENQMLRVAQWWDRMPTPKKLAIVTDTAHSPSSGRAYAAALQQTVRESHGRVVLMDPIYDLDRLDAVRANAFACIHGHSVGGTNPSLLEAMACARPIIAHDNEFNREVLGETGIYFDRQDSLSSAVSCLEQHPESCSRLAASVLARVQGLYSWSRTMGIFRDEILPLIAR